MGGGEGEGEGGILVWGFLAIKDQSCPKWGLSSFLKHWHPEFPWFFKSFLDQKGSEMGPQ